MMKKLLQKKWPIAALAFFLAAVIALPFLLNGRAVSAERSTLANLNIDSGDTIVAYGVDISYWQQEVDFDALYQAGADYVILRAGFSSTVDSFFEENYRMAKQAGLDVGAYWFSYAMTAEDAEKEAEACLQVLDGKTFEYPIYFDYEYEPQSTFAPEVTEQICLAFIDKLTENGYYTGIYSSVNWLRYIIPEDPIQTEHPVWMAMFSNSRTYELYENYCDSYGMWQYSESGTAGGVNGNVDMDICFVDYPSIIRAGGWNGYARPEQSGELFVKDALMPDVLSTGEVFRLGGTVTSRLDELRSVTVCVYDDAGQELFRERAACSGTTYDLEAMDTPDFTQLKAGSYCLQVLAETDFAELTVLRRPFYVHSPLVSLTGFSCADCLPQNDSFRLEGTISSENAPISDVLIEILNSNGYYAIRSVEFSPAAESFDLSQWAGTQELAPGRYTCLVSAANSFGACVVMCRDFSVFTAKASLEDGTYELFSEALTYADLSALNLRFTLTAADNGTYCITDENGACLTAAAGTALTFEKNYSLACQSFRLLPTEDGGYYLLNCSENLFLQIDENGSLILSSVPATIYLS